MILEEKGQGKRDNCNSELYIFAIFKTPQLFLLVAPKDVNQGREVMQKRKQYFYKWFKKLFTKLFDIDRSVGEYAF